MKNLTNTLLALVVAAPLGCAPTLEGVVEDPVEHPSKNPNLEGIEAVSYFELIIDDDTLNNGNDCNEYTFSCEVGLYTSDDSVHDGYSECFVGQSDLDEWQGNVGHFREGTGMRTGQCVDVSSKITFFRGATYLVRLTGYDPQGNASEPIEVDIDTADFFPEDLN